MRRQSTQLLLCLSLSLLAACGDDPAPAKTTNAAAAKVDSTESRSLGLHMQGLAFWNQGKFAEALKVFEDLCQLEPNNLEAQFNRATMLGYLERREEALAVYDELLAKTPDDPAIFQNRAAILLDLGRHEEALIGVDRALASLRDAPAPRLLRSRILAKLGRNEEALADLDLTDQLIARSAEGQAAPMLVQSRLYRAALLEALGRAGEAETIFAEVRASHGEDPNVKRLLTEMGKL